MRHIGSGWQFDAYASGSDVLKVPISSLRMSARVLRSYPALLWKPLQLGRKIERLMTERRAVLQELERRKVDPELLANFRRDRGRYVQDYVRTLEDILDEGKLDPFWLMDRYVASILRGWKNGLAETSFNFTVNHGLNRRGRVVIIDVGELTFSREEALRLVESRFWEKAYSVAQLPGPVRDYLIRLMDRVITADRLQREWRDAPRTALAEPAADRAPSRRKRATVTAGLPRLHV